MGLSQAEAAELMGATGAVWHGIESTRRRDFVFDLIQRAVAALGGRIEIYWREAEDTPPPTVIALFGNYQEYFTTPEDAALALSLAERAYEVGRWGREET